MLARMIVGGVPAQNASPQFSVSSDAEWDAVFAQPPEMLAGSTLVVSGDNFTQRSITDCDLSAFAQPLTIRSADPNARLPSLQLNGTVRGIDFSGVNFQMTGWPHTYGACVVFGSGTFGKLRFLNGTTFRHGYGTDLTDIVTDVELPEYERVDNVYTATTTSTAHPLTWLDPTAPTGWIEFFNRGSETVYLAVGGAGIAADVSSTACAPGARTRISKLDPDIDTHIAILAASNSSEINARTEIGLTEYLANAFQQTGGAQLENIELRNCLFRDLSSGAKSLRPAEFGIVMDCDFDRIYQDIIAFSPPPGGALYILRNVESLPFSRAGIAENLNGDARDPHGDQFQMFSDGSATVGPVFYAGNRIRFTARRPGSKSQGIFVSDNDFDPSYSDLYFISTMQVGGSGRALSLGEENTTFKVRDAFVYGATVFDSADIASDLPFVLIDHDNDGTIYVGKSVASAFRASDANLQLDDNFVLADAADRNAIFPNFGNFTVGADRTALDAAFATAAEGEGRGAIATSNALDWITRDHTAVILWENLPSGAHWNRQTNEPLDSVVDLPLRKIMNLRPVQEVIPGPGTEWRSIASDGVTEIQAWTGLDGTIESGQFIQARVTSSSSPGGSVTASVTINGFEQSVEIVTSAAPTVFLEQGDPIGYFQDPSNVPAGTSRISSRGKFRFASEIPNGAKPFAQVSTGCDLFTRTDGSLNATVEDGTGAKMMTNLPVAPEGSLLPDTWHEMEFDVDQVAGQVRVTIDGVTTVTAFTATGNGVFQSNRSILLVAGSNGNTPLPTGTRFADLSVDLDGVRHKTISNDAASANGDAWHLGGAF